MSPRPSLRPLAGLVLRTQADSRLVSLVREGHECAFEEIVRRYRSALVGFAAGFVPRHQAEDVVQDSLVRAHRALGGGNEIELRPWLYTIVRNRALNALRDEHPHEHLSEDYDGVPQPPDVLARREEVAGLVARIKALPESQRQAIVKRELEGRSHEEIALALGATPGAVRGLIFRAREGLRTVAGFFFPPTLVNALLGSADTTGAIGGAAAGGGAGFLLKAGVAVTVGALAVGSGIMVHNRSPRQSIRVAESPHGRHAAREAAVVAPAAQKLARDGRSSAESRGTGSGSGGSPSADGAGGGAQDSSNSGPGSSDGGSTSSASGSGQSGSGDGSDDTNSGDGGGDSSSSGDGGTESADGGGTSGDGGSGDGGATSGTSSGSGSGELTSGGSDGSDGSGSGSSGSDGSGSGDTGSGGSLDTTTTPDAGDVIVTGGD